MTRTPPSLHATPFSSTEFKDVKVEADAVIPNGKIVYDAMMLTRIYIAAGKLGHMDRCLQLIQKFSANLLIANRLMSQI